MILRDEIRDLCKYSDGFTFDVAYNLPVFERKLQLKLLNEEFKKKRAESSNDGKVLKLDDTISNDKISSILSKVKSETHSYNAPKK